MAKPLITQLQDALAKGDIEAARKISDKIAAKTPKKEQAAPSRLILPGQDNSSWMAPSRAPGATQGSGSRPRQGGGVIAGMETVQGVGTNKFRGDAAKDDLPARVKKLDKANAKQGAIARREPTAKVQAQCEGCNRPFAVYPSELTASVDEEGRPYHVYKCERCIRRGR